MINVTYSPFAKLGDLSFYNLSQLVEIGASMSFKLSEDSLYKIAEWSNEFTLIIMRFHADGTFDQIIREVWKKENMEIGKWR